MSFQRSCLFHQTLGMRVIEADQEEEYKRLLETGDWFDHPTKAKNVRENHEEQIRRSTREGRSNAKHASKKV